MSPLLLGVALGAASAFMLDPQLGRRRRAFVRDKVERSREFADAASQDIRQRARGIAARARSLRGGAAPDDVVAERESHRPELAPGNWSPGVRAIAGGAGALLLLYALARGGVGGIGALAIGAALLGRASANRPLSSFFRKQS